METTLRVEGLKELQRAFRQVDDELRKDMQKGLQKVAKIVADDAKSRLDSRYGGGAGRYIRARVKGTSGIAESRARSTGAHPNFGGLVMRHGLIPARAAKADQVRREFETMLDKLGRGAGF